MRFVFQIFCYLFALSGISFEISVDALSAILMNQKTGRVLYEKQAHTELYPASTTKIATALYVLDSQVDLQEQAVVSQEALQGRSHYEHPYGLDHDGMVMGLRVKEVLSIEVLLHGLMLVSGNDAANVIAEHVGGSVAGFMERVNGYLHQLGCKNTHFCNPHGLTYVGHKTTAYDLALMTKRALEIPAFRELVSKPSYFRSKSNKQPEGEIVQTNPLLNPKSRYYYPKAIGVKTGYTEAAKYNLVAAARSEERELIAVVLGCKEAKDRFEIVKKLFEMAFEEKKRTRRLLGPENLLKRKIVGAKELLKASLRVPLKISFYPSEEPECKAVLHWQTEKLPISKGEKVGEVHIIDERGELLVKESLFAKEDLNGSFLELCKEGIRKLFY